MHSLKQLNDQQRVYEQILIADIFIKPDNLVFYQSIIKPEFLTSMVKSIYENALALYRQKQSVTIVDFISQPAEKDYIASAVANAGWDDPKQLAKAIVSLHQKRLVLQSAGDDINKLDVSKLIEQIQSTNYVDPVIDDLQSIDEIENEAAAVRKQGVRTGYNKLDKLTGGLIPGEVWIIGGMPGTGKSYFIQQMMLNGMRERMKDLVENSYLYFSLENRKRKINQRFIANIAGLNTKNLSLAAMNPIEAERFKNALDELRIHTDTYLAIDSVFDVENLEQVVRSSKFTRKINVVVVDFAQNFKIVGDEYSTLTNLAVTLQNIANKYNVAVIIVSQLNNEAIKSGKYETAFKGTGAFMQVADVAIILSRDLEGDPKRLVANIVKNREGEQISVNYSINFPGGRVYEEH